MDLESYLINPLPLSARKQNPSSVGHTLTGMTITQKLL